MHSLRFWKYFISITEIVFIESFFLAIWFHLSLLPGNRILFPEQPAWMAVWISCLQNKAVGAECKRQGRKAGINFPFQRWLAACISLNFKLVHAWKMQYLIPVKGAGLVILRMPTFQQIWHWTRYNLVGLKVAQFFFWITSFYAVCV